MNMSPLLSLALAISLTAWDATPAASQNNAQYAAAGPTKTVVLSSDIKWEQLNPLRGDKSPKAGTLWGDRTGPGPAGFLLKPVDGFRSPPHIHNVAYRGVVISGLLHNDDPNATDMWMPAGSFWTQPAGEVHITAAKGSNSIAYIEVEDGFGVLPAAKAFDDGERPVNVDRSNIVWLDASNVAWIAPSAASADGDGPQIAFLWGKPRDRQLNGTLIKLPAGYSGMIRSQGGSLRAVVIQGRAKHRDAAAKALDPGSYFGSKGKSEHRVSCEAGVDCILYARSEGMYDIMPAQAKK